MANLVKLYGTRVELPFQAHQYSLTPAASNLQAALEAFQTLERDGALHALPLAERQEVTRFLYQFGHLLFRTLFPDGPVARLAPAAPLLLELGQDWSAYPWELLNDGHQWLALSRGVMRYAHPPVPTPPRPAPRSQPLRVLGASALPLGAGSGLAQDAQQLGTRFVVTLPHLADEAPERRAPIEHRLLEHATLPALEQALARRAHVLLFSGFASDEGWYLEDPRGAPQCAPWEWLLQRLRDASAQGLRLVVLADSLGLTQPAVAARRTGDILRAGVPAVIRLEGHVGRERLQAYLRALLGALAGGSAVDAAHQQALRGLFRAHEEAWDWCFLRLYPQGIAAAERIAVAPQVATEVTTEVTTEAPAPAFPEDAPPGPLLDASTAGERFASLPAPPALRDRRRCFNRSAQQKRLLEALCPDTAPTSPLVLLSGPPGSGKTHLALELARRVQRRFGEVLYLPRRALLPDAERALPEHNLPAPDAAPALALLGTLAAQLGVRGAPPGAPLGALPGTAQPAGAELREALQRHCADGMPRLLILDRWERQEGYDAFCEALQELPAPCRVLLISRARPPLVRGTPLELGPLSGEELAHVFGSHLAERLRATGDGGALEALCREDLLLARLLRRAPRLPERGVLDPILALTPGADAKGAGSGTGSAAPALLRWLVARTLPTLSAPVRAVLPVLAFCPWLAHRDVLAAGADLEPPQVEAARAALHGLGWVDTYDGGRYVALHPRLHALVAERVLHPGTLERLQSRLLRGYRRYLGGVAATFRDAPARWLREPPPLLAWSEARGVALPPAWVRGLHRLAVERVNLAELALLLTDSGEWRSLEQLVHDAAPLVALRELDGLGALLHRALLVAGEQQADPVLQADALNRLAGPLVDAQRAEQALPLLERAQALLQRTAGWHVLGETQRLLARCHELSGRLDAAEGLLRATAELAQQLGDGALLAHASQGLARIWTRRPAGPTEGESFLARQATYLHQNDRPLEAALVLRAQAELLLRRGERVAARERLDEVLAACREAGHAAETARTLLRLAECDIATGDADGALSLLSDAAAQNAATEADLEEQGRLLSEICRLFEQRGQVPQALEAYLRIRGVLEQIGDREALVAVLDRIGGLYFQLGEQAKSTRCYEERLHLQATLAAS